MKQTYRQYSNQPKKHPSKAAQVLSLTYLVFSAILEIALVAACPENPWLHILGLFNFVVAWINATHKELI